MSIMYDLHPNNSTTFHLGTEVMVTISIDVELTLNCSKKIALPEDIPSPGGFCFSGLVRRKDPLTLKDTLKLRL